MRRERHGPKRCLRAGMRSGGVTWMPRRGSGTWRRAEAQVRRVRRRAPGPKRGPCRGAGARAGKRPGRRGECGLANRSAGVRGEAAPGRGRRAARGTELSAAGASTCGDQAWRPGASNPRTGPQEGLPLPLMSAPSQPGSAGASGAGAAGSSRGVRGGRGGVWGVHIRPPASKVAHSVSWRWSLGLRRVGYEEPQSS